METELIMECPFGSKCEEIKENKLHRCKFYTHIRGKNPQGTEDLDHWDCAFVWLPVLLIENAQTNRGQTQTLASFRNEMIKNQEGFYLMFASEMERRKNLEILEQKVAQVLLEQAGQSKLLTEKPKGEVIDVKEE